MFPNFEIRKAEESDAHGIARVHVNSWKVAYKGIIPELYIKNITLENRILNWQKILKNNEQITYVAEKEKSVIGFISGGNARGVDTEFDAEINALYVDPDCQQEGVGRALTLNFARSLKNAGFSSMTVRVLEDNPCYKFYNKIGGVKSKQFTYRNFYDKKLKVISFGWKSLTQLIKVLSQN